MAQNFQLCTPTIVTFVSKMTNLEMVDVRCTDFFEVCQVEEILKKCTKLLVFYFSSMTSFSSHSRAWIKLLEEEYGHVEYSTEIEARLFDIQDIREEYHHITYLLNER